MDELLRELSDTASLSKLAARLAVCLSFLSQCAAVHFLVHNQASSLNVECFFVNVECFFAIR